MVLSNPAIHIPRQNNFPTLMALKFAQLGLVAMYLSTLRATNVKTLVNLLDSRILYAILHMASPNTQSLVYVA